MADFDDLFGRTFSKLIDVMGEKDSEQITYAFADGSTASRTLDCIFNEQVGPEDFTDDGIFHIWADDTRGVASPTQGDQITRADGGIWRVTKTRRGSDGTHELRARGVSLSN